MTWHVAEVELRGYTAQRLPHSRAWSVEAHIVRCSSCRQRVNDAALEEGPEVSTVVRRASEGLRGTLPPQGKVRTPSRRRRMWALLGWAWGGRGAWLLAVLFALASALFLDHYASSQLLNTVPVSTWWVRHGSMLTLVAPLLPVLGVALSYGGIDPAREVTTSTALGGLPLILWRTLAVALVTVPLSLLFGVFTDRASAAIWLLPCAALTSLTLALGSLVRLEIAGGAVGFGWLLLTSGQVASMRVPVVLAEPLPLVWLTLTAVALAAIYLRRRAFHQVTLVSEEN